MTCTNVWYHTILCKADRDLQRAFSKLACGSDVIFLSPGVGTQSSPVGTVIPVQKVQMKERGPISIFRSQTGQTMSSLRWLSWTRTPYFCHLFSQVKKRIYCTAWDIKHEIHLETVCLAVVLFLCWNGAEPKKGQVSLSLYWTHTCHSSMSPIWVHAHAIRDYITLVIDIASHCMFPKYIQKKLINQRLDKMNYTLPLLTLT